MDDAGGVRGAAGGDHGARAAVPGRGRRGTGVREITLVTTLLDAAAYPAAALAELYFRRWRVEINFRHLKITMKMDVLRCETVEGVLKELAVFALAYNLVRSVMVRVGAGCRGWRRSGSAWSTRCVGWSASRRRTSSVLVVNPSRRGRVEPRVVKRRPKQYITHDQATSGTCVSRCQ